MPFPFLGLPPELRERVYSLILSTSTAARTPSPRSDDPPYYEYDLSLLRVGRLVHQEAKKCFEDNVFIKIMTPWSSSIERINNEGKIPLVCRGPKADAFTKYHLLVFIDTVETYGEAHGMVNMVTTLESLPAFTQMWRYANLNHQKSLNPYLQLGLTLQDPHVRDRKLPKSLQEQLILPFEWVKDLGSIRIKYDKLLPSVKTRLSELRSLDEPTAVQCINRSFVLKDAGNVALNAGKYQEALDLYTQAFAAIHITVRGRTRIVYADGYFCVDITGQHQGRGDQLRMQLRIKLVANVILAYLKLGEYAEAHFWGKRTIILFRQNISGSFFTTFGSAANDENGGIEILSGAFSEDETTLDVSALEDRFIEDLQLTRFPNQGEMGKIFYRTALAAREMGKVADVRTLIRAAAVYLPYDEAVIKEKRKLDMEEAERRRTEGEANF